MDETTVLEYNVNMYLCYYNKMYFYNCDKAESLDINLQCSLQ